MTDREKKWFNQLAKGDREKEKKRMERNALWVLETNAKIGNINIEKYPRTQPGPGYNQPPPTKVVTSREASGTNNNLKNEKAKSNDIPVQRKEIEIPTLKKDRNKEVEIPAPRKPVSAFFYFCEAKRPRVRNDNPRMKMGEISRELTKMWMSSGPKRPRVRNDNPRMKMGEISRE